MSNPFATPAMAAGYAADRPPMHARVLARVRDDLAALLPCERALDVGCGAGLSTAPLVPLARQCFGLEPVVAMLGPAPTLAPGARFLAGAAERLPLAPASIDLVTAAGSLNFTRLDAALAEIRRVLAPGGVLVAYDWSAARTFADDDALEQWATTFEARYPRPPSEAIPLDPQILGARATGFRLTDAVEFAWPLSMTLDAFARYMLTETRVAAAIRGGTPRDAIAAWCTETLAGVFAGRPREVVFRGYIAYLSPAG